MTKIFAEPEWDLSGLVGKHVVYTYSNGWEYEVYYKNEETIDYRVISGLVGGRMVKGQKVEMKALRAPTKDQLPIRPDIKSLSREVEVPSSQELPGPDKNLSTCAEELYMISWTEPTGTCVSQVVDLAKREVTTAIFFPQWVIDEPSKTVCFQNDHLSRMLSYRDNGPTHPYHLSHLFGRIHLIEDRQPNNEQVIC